MAIRLGKSFIWLFFYILISLQNNTYEIGKWDMVRGAKAGGEKMNKSAQMWGWSMLGAQLMPSPRLSDERMIMRTKWREEKEKVYDFSKASVCFFCHLLFFARDEIVVFHHSSPLLGPCNREQFNLSCSSNSNMCTAEGEVMHNILVASLPFNITLNNAMLCQFLSIKWLQMLQYLYSLRYTYNTVYVVQLKQVENRKQTHFSIHIVDKSVSCRLSYFIRSFLCSGIKTRMDENVWI